MSDTAITVENLSKRFRIGQNQPFVSLRETLMGVIAHPFRRGDRDRQAGGRDDEIWALKDVSFKVGRGEVLGIIGSNGAGKSTLLKIISRITGPTSGRVEIRGRVGSLLEVGTGFHPELTGRENIFLNGAILGMKRREIERNFDEIVDFSGVEKFIGTPVKRYSSGMYVRLAFAVAAHLEPEVLLVDEVLAVGDVAFQKRCLRKMEDTAESGRTVLFVSHNMPAVRALCSRVLCLRDGKVACVGPADEVVREYLASSTSVSNERVWEATDDAPGNERVRVKRAAVTAQTGPPAGPFDMTTPLAITVELEPKIVGLSLDATLHLRTEDHEVAFSTSTVHSLQRAFGGTTSPVRVTCHIPGNLLNQRRYSIDLLVLEDRSRAILLETGLLSFEVQDNPATRGNYYGKRPGAVQPLLEWDVEPLGSNGASGPILQNPGEEDG